MRESKYLKDDAKNIQRLLEIPIFQDFEIGSLGGLLQISRIREYKDGECIIKEGERYPWIYFLYSGRVKIVKQGLILADLRRCGDVFGEMGMIGGLESSASAIAVGKTSCLATDASKIDDIAGKDRLTFNCILYRRFAEIVTERLKSTTDQLFKTKKELARLKSMQESLAA